MAGNYRRLVWLSGRADAELRSWLAGVPAARLWWFGSDPPAGVHGIARSQARRELGGECDRLVFDARAGFDADAFGALAGALVEGGVLVLLTPERVGRQAGRFETRLYRALERAKDARPAVPASVPDAAPEIVEPAAVTADQARAVAGLVRVARGHRRRPLVLTADRGRGKSAALGIAAARLLQQQAETCVLVTAPRPGAVAALFDRVEHLLGTRRPAGLVFVAPDELVRNPRAADLVLVDEAAALPVALLERLLRRYARIAFATTVHGYEGTGRGFAVRFRRVLDAVTPGWRELRMATPIRWPSGDPLERFTFDALLLDAAPAPDGAVRRAALPECTIDRVDRAELIGKETELRELFGLLVLAHYQTRPSDLQRLLDDPDVTVWAMRYADHVVATALVVAEGGLDRNLAEAVAAGRRRASGHLLAQALALHEGIISAARLSYARVKRIAVHPALRRRGLGSALLERIARELPAVDFLGTSFGATPELLAFWQRAGLRPVRLGVRRDAASGTHSAMLLRPLTPDASALYDALRARFLERLPYLLPDGFEMLEPELVVGLSVEAPAAGPGPRELVDLNAFAAGRRDYAGVLDTLWLAGWRALADGRVVTLDPPAREVLVRRVLQKRPWAEVAVALGLPGRPQVEALLRQVARDLAGGLEHR